MFSYDAFQDRHGKSDLGNHDTPVRGVSGSVLGLCDRRNLQVEAKRGFT